MHDVNNGFVVRPGGFSAKQQTVDKAGHRNLRQQVRYLKLQYSRSVQFLLERQWRTENCLLLDQI